MANVQAPFGFSQRSGTGSSPTYEQVPGVVNGNTSAIFYGDPVARLSDGTLAGNTTSSAPGNVTIAGIFTGATYISVSQQKRVWNNYWPGSDVVAGGNLSCYIINDPQAQFLVQAGNSTTLGVALGNIGQNVQFIYGTGNVTSHISGAALDIGFGMTANTTYPFRILSLVTSPPGSPGTAAGAYNYAVVGFANVETRLT